MLRHPLRDRRIWRISVGSALLIVTQVAITGFVVLFFESQHDFSARAGRRVLAAMNVFGAAGRLLGGSALGPARRPHRPDPGGRGRDRGGDRVGRRGCSPRGAWLSLPRSSLGGGLSMSWNALAVAAVGRGRRATRRRCGARAPADVGGGWRWWSRRSASRRSSPRRPGAPASLVAAALPARRVACCARSAVSDTARMERVLVLAGDAAEDLETYFILYRLREAGYAVDVAAPSRQDDAHGRPRLRARLGCLRREARTAARARSRLLRRSSPSATSGLVIPGGRAPEYIRVDPDVRRIVAHFFDRDLPVGTLCHGPQVPAASATSRVGGARRSRLSPRTSRPRAGRSSTAPTSSTGI